MKNKNVLNYYTYELDLVFLNILSLVIFGITWGIVMILGGSNYLWSSHNVGFLVIFMVLWLMLHEVLHGIGFYLFPSVRKSNIVFGVALEKGVFYCMCKQKIGKRVILTSLLFPFVFIGIVTLIWGMIIQSYYLVMLSILNIAGAVGDLVMICYFLKVPNDVIYMDLDDCTSFTVLSKDDLTSFNVKGVKLKNFGEYDASNMIAKDKRRLIVSKTSYIVLIGLLLLALFMIF